MTKKGKKKKQQAAAASTSQDTSSKELQQQTSQQQQEQEIQEQAASFDLSSKEEVSKSLKNQIQQPQRQQQQQQTLYQQQPQSQPEQLQASGSRQQQPQTQPQQPQAAWGSQQQQPQQSQAAWGPRQQQPQASDPRRQQPHIRPQQPQVAWGPRQQQSQQSQAAWGSRQQQPQSQPQQQAAWGPRQQQSQSQLQQPQSAWGPRQQQPQALGTRQQQPHIRSQQPQAAWGPRQQQSQSQPQAVWDLRQQQLQIPSQQVAQSPQQPQQAQTAWGLRQQVSQSQLQQMAQSPQQAQTAWGPRQQIPQSKLQQQTAWGSRQQVPQSQLQQQVVQSPQKPQQTPQADIGAAGDHRQLQAGDSDIHRQQSSTSTKSLDISELSLTDPFDSKEKTEKGQMTALQLQLYYEMIPKRTHPNKGGSVGEQINVWTNMFKIIFDKNFVTNAVHYNVTIKPYKESTRDTKNDTIESKLPKALCRNLFEQFRNKHFKNRYPAYDGKKNAFSANDLPFNHITDVFEHRNENDRRNKYEITINKVAHVDLNWLKYLKPGNLESVKDQTAVQVLDIIMRHAPESRFMNIGRSLFWNPDMNESLGDGVALARGGFMSGVVGWQPYLNLDVSHKGFTIKQDILTYLREVVNVPINRLTSENVRSYDTKIQNFLKGLKVVYEISTEKCKLKRTHRIVNLSYKDSFTVFTMESENRKEKITIKEYFLKYKGYSIKWPKLPTLLVKVKPDKSEILLPIELCYIMANQPLRKLDEKQTANMIMETAIKAPDRKQRIMDAFRAIQVNDSPVMTEEFHVSVSNEMEKVSARVLPAPNLQYRQGKATPRQGTWNLQTFNKAKDLEDNSWTIVNMSGTSKLEPSMQEFVKSLQETAREVGMTIGKSLVPFKNIRLNEIKDYFNNNNKLKLIIVVLPNSTDVTYGNVKKISEIDVGVLTQCIKLKTLKFKTTKATLKNILLKINSKLNGVNHTFDKMPSCLSEQYPCMLIGADVTHPSPDSRDVPSIAAVAASTDKSAFRYNVALRLQPPKKEIISDLEKIVLSQLEIFKNKTNSVPRRIIYYRDGVSEGQLPQVMYHEIEAIKKAISTFSRAQIEITCMVVQKRHHVRLFPLAHRPEYTDDRKNGNVRVGTIVDTTITHPDHIDFYLVSHASIQGTARPTKYRCICNESNFSEDQLEQLTYYLCHIYARCARSVSYPAPTYYAHLGAYRGRALIQGTKFNLNKLEEEQKKFIIKMEESPMFFV